MKKIFKLSYIAAIALALLGAVACSHRELDTDQLSGPIALAAVSPNPVVRGAELHLFGSNMDKVVEVRIPGIDPIKTITKGQGQGTLSEIVVTVPLEGPEVGKVVVADASGNTSSTKFDLTYTEGMVFEDFSCKEEVMPGDVITLTGEYLNNIQEVIFASGDGLAYATGSMIFDKTRHSTKVYVPAAATSGIIKICDVDESADPNAIPNIYPSTKTIKVGKPTVDVMEFEKNIKAGTVLKFTGSYLNMVAKVTFSGKEQEEFSVSDDASELNAALPSEAADGDVVFTTYAGDTFVAGTLKGVRPSGLTISPDMDSKDPRYKAGYRTVILGDDLDLVTGVSFGGVSASFEYLNESVPDSLVAVIPMDAPDGDVVLSLANGANVVVDQIAMVNPTVKKVSKTAIVAREKFEIEGLDMELISKLSVGGIECKIALDTLDVVDGLDEEGDPIKIAVLDSTKVIVTTDPTILTGDVVIEKLNGWSQVISQMDVTYEELVSLVVPEKVSLGEIMTVTGTNLFAIDRVYIKGKQVVNWTSRTDTEMKFSIPEGVGPGSYKLVLDLNDGSTITWAISFEVKASYTETFIWEGKHDLASWGSNLEITPNGFKTVNLKEGDVVRIYYTSYSASWWMFKVQDGSWKAVNLNIPDNPQDPNVICIQTAPSGENQFFAIEVTAEIAEQLLAPADKAMAINGDGAYILGVSVLQPAATEKVIWEGEEYSGDDYNNNIQLGGEEDWVNAGLEEGQKVRVYFTTSDEENWQVQVFDGHWNALSELGLDGDKNNQFNAENTPNALKKGYVEFEAKGDIYTKLTTKAWWGYAIILQGKKVTFTKVAFI